MVKYKSNFNNKHKATNLHLTLDFHSGGSCESDEPEQESGGDAPLIKDLQVDMHQVAASVPPELLEPTPESGHSTPQLEQASDQDGWNFLTSRKCAILGICCEAIPRQV